MENELWLIWKDPKKRIRYKVGTLRYLNDTYYFEYTNPELDDAIKAGFKYYPGFEDLNEKYESNVLFANIFTRLPNEYRPDYLSILNAFNLNSNSTCFEILKETRGRLLTDNYEFVPSFDEKKIEFDIAGTRYIKELDLLKDKLDINVSLYLEVENNNKYDESAIKIKFESNGNYYYLGYVPKYYSKYIKDILEKNISYSAMINGINFDSKIYDEHITVKVKLIFDN